MKRSLKFEPQNVVITVLGCLLVVALLANGVAHESREQVLLAFVMLVVVATVSLRSAQRAGEKEAARLAKRRAGSRQSKRRRKR